ncbi:hypothetical protein B0H14DRAFT_3876867 [Mycena olivaceomarginata]|nr:hypothetical protein B0H14DRAFT_3876867 [Mycena olivaceomarginata]
MTHLLRGAPRSRTDSNPFRTGMPPFFPPRCTSTSSAPSAVATSPHPRGPRVFASSARAPPVSNPLRRRMHLLERAASRSFTTAESSTRNGDVEDDEDEFELGSEGEGDNAQSPPTSFEAEYDDEEAGSGAWTAARHEGDGREEEEDEDEDEDGGEEHYHGTPTPHLWYKPSVPVLIALAPPIGNWLTGGDHVKDLLLVFYLQIIEVPGPSTTPPAPAARPPRVMPPPIPIPAYARVAPPAPNLPSAPSTSVSSSSASSRPLLGVALMRSLASLSSPSSCSSAAPVSISWFSTALFGLVTALRPPARARLARRLAHEHAPLSNKNTDAESTQAQLAALRAQVARLELAVAQLAVPDREDALYAYVEDARAPLEKGVRRVERCVGRLRAARKELEGRPSPIRARPRVRVPVRVKARQYSSPLSRNIPPRRRFALVSSWFGGPPPPPHTAYVPPPLSPTNGSGAGKRRALDSIPEEEGVDVPLHVLPHPRHTHPAYTRAHADAGGTLLPLLRAWLAACVALAFVTRSTSC